MRVKIDEEIRSICRTIMQLGHDEATWARIESIDAFQTDQVCGMFDCCDMVFTFGIYEGGIERYTIQFSLEQVPMIANGIMKAIEVEAYGG